MNLHIVPDSSFINKFYSNLAELGLLSQNRIVVRTNSHELKVIRHDVPFARLYSREFSRLTGDTSKYDKVFIHYFTPLMYRWVATHNFKELNWMIWGGDLYNLPALDHLCYEYITFNQYVAKDWSLPNVFYRLKILFAHSIFKTRAYSKVSNILTWMDREYRFACEHLGLNAAHQFFFYENDTPYRELDKVAEAGKKQNARPLLIIGNSGVPANNHLDIVAFLESNNVKANLLLPVSYGDARYIRFLKKNLRYSHGEIQFIDRYMQFEEYVNFLAAADALVMNTIRPQGYGNILMMMYLNKPVFFNEKNISLPDLTRYGIKWQTIKELVSYPALQRHVSNKDAVLDVLSHATLLQTYQRLFA